MQTISDTIPFDVRDARTGRSLRLTLQRLWLTGRVLPVGAELRVQHGFQSGESGPVEVVYAFALPRDAALRRFRIRGEGWSVDSELRPLAEAERLYEQGITAGHMAAWVRSYRDGVVNLTLGNLRPGAMVWVDLELLAGVDPCDDGWRFRFPFTLAPTYHPGARTISPAPGMGELELPAEFGDVLLPPWMRDATQLHKVGFDLQLVLPAPLREVRCPSHRIVVDTSTPRQARVTLATETDVPNRDLVLEARFAGELEGLVGGIADRTAGGFALMIPSTRFTRAHARADERPRRVVFVLDRSGSMSGEPLTQARRAVEACLGACTDRDLFGVVAFDHTVESFSDTLVSADRCQRNRAQAWLAGVEAVGGTELLAGIRAGAALLGDEGGDLLVLTDGQVAGTEDILQSLPQGRVRVHCLGIGTASQDRFLALLPRRTGGRSKFLTPSERVDLAVLELFASMHRTLARHLQVQLHPSGPTSARLTIPPPHVLAEGQPLVLWGEADAPGEVRVRIEWETGAGHHRLEVPVTLGPSQEAGVVRLLQGARLITDAESDVREADPESATDATARAAWVRLEELSRRYGLASRAMSLVAVVRRPGDQPGAPPRTMVVPVGMPEHVLFDAYFAPHAPAPAPRMRMMALSLAAPPRLEQERPTSGPGEGAAERTQSHKSKRAGNRPWEEDLFELAARLEPDGGLPGADPEQRWFATALAWLCFVAACERLQTSAFRAHTTRLRRWLDHSELTQHDPRKRRWLDRARQGALALPDPQRWTRRLLRGDRIEPREFWDMFEPAS